MININEGFESKPINLEEESVFTEEQLRLNLEQSKLQKAKIEEQLAELELKNAGSEHSKNDLDYKVERETLLMMLNEAIKEAEEKLGKL